MFTEPAYRGRSVGTRILREAMRIARQRGFRRIVRHAAPLGRPLYRRLGFERTWEMRRWPGGAPPQTRAETTTPAGSPVSRPKGNVP